ncbi:hypothetical protein [Dictyobacter formicarum]|uniref:Uncharacterized protein n=1 Tax=Dictyobacter formicarum TaxID=2778368 RepID=A0ABQ3VPZ8_9CHLR|nr:hypothetical protein [Dictyobacter formicarum]GHO87181.1 hypothetical protein KSZ_51870 [Dictyobacter formicarum]
MRLEVPEKVARVGWYAGGVTAGLKGFLGADWRADWGTRSGGGLCFWEASGRRWEQQRLMIVRVDGAEQSSAS